MHPINLRQQVTTAHVPTIIIGIEDSLSKFAVAVLKKR